MKLAAIFLFIFLFATLLNAQPVTGVWRGKVTRGNPPFSTTYKLEVKLIKQGDSLTGTSYYYANANNFFRYSIKGFIDPVDASIHWWDENLLEKKGGTSVINPINSEPLAMQTDFNCPGGGTMMLDGSVETKAGNEMTVHLDKQEQPMFTDDWDALIENWFFGGADPDLIAQAEAQQQTQKNEPPPAVVSAPVPVEKRTKPTASASAPPPEKKPAPPVSNPAPVVQENTVAKPAPAAAPPPLTTQEKWESRQRVTQTTLPLAGDSIELQFFDNAEIDGDSISLFLNGKIIFEHVRLSAEPFVLKLAVADLSANSELAMVAENLGAIPPNTSFMMAYVNGERYTARLESTEKTTAVIRFQKGSAPAENPK